jgi:hypothetical protein
MTQIFGGFDDFAGMSLWRDTGWTESSVPVAANTVHELVYDRNMSFAGMLIELAVSAFAVRVDFIHRRSSSDSSPLYSDNFVLSAGTTLLAAVPFLSNLFAINWLTPLANGNTLSVKTQQVNICTDRMHFFGLDRQVGQTGVVMANGAVTTVQPTSFLPGPGHAFVTAAGNPAGVDLRIDCVNKDGVQGPRIFQAFTNGGPVTANLQIPHTQWVATVSNFSGAAQTVSWGVVMEGR